MGKNNSKEVQPIENDKISEKPISEEKLNELIEDIPQPVVRSIRQVMAQMSISNEPPGFTKFMASIGDKLTPDHLTLIFNNADKSDKRGFLHSLISRFGAGLLIIIVIAAFIFILNMFMNDREMVLEIIKMVAVFLGGLGGGFGGGYFLGRRKR